MKLRNLAVFTGVFFLLVAAVMRGGATGYTLTLDTQGAGSVIPDNNNNPHPPGVVITITATPNIGWYFANWSGAASGTGNPLQVTMNSSLVITGNFLAYPQYALALTTNGPGTIGLSPSGGSYYSNTLVTATATPAAGWVFTGWSGAATSSINPVTLTMNTNAALAATFAQLPAMDLQPVSATNGVGSTAGFTTHAVGNAPVNYNWFFNGALVSGATSSTLTLTNVQLSQAGNYWAVATNLYGSATSQVATLTIPLPVVGPTNTVTSASESSLRAAIALGGWVGLEFNGSITLTSTIQITNNVVLDATGFGATLSGGSAVRLFYVATNASLAATNVTFANGNMTVAGGTGSTADAGGIYNDGGTVILTGSMLTNNTASSQSFGGAGRGGALFNHGGNVSLLQTTFAGNSAVGGGFSGVTNTTCTDYGLGGALFNTNGSVNLLDCTFSNNLCEGLVAGGTFVIFTQGVGHQTYTEAHGQSMGGAIYQASGTLNVTSTMLASNLSLGGVGAASVNTGFYGGAAYGGALAADGGTISLNQDQFVGNLSRGGDSYPYTTCNSGPGLGGAVYSAGQLGIWDTSLIGNESMGGVAVNGGLASRGLGGAIYNAGTLALNRSTIISNLSMGGMALAIFNSGATGDGLGGGIFNSSQMTATNCTIALNIALGGDGDMYSAHNTICWDGNALGGGVFNSTNAVFTGVNLTIASNNCLQPVPDYIHYANGLDVGSQLANTNGTLYVYNTLIAYSGTNYNVYGTISDGGYNICSDASAHFFGFSYNNTDPRLASLGNYGGPTLCMALQANSPAIDFGGSVGVPTTDQRGYARPVGDGFDMGAYEYGAVASGNSNPLMNIGLSGTNLMLSFTATATSTCLVQWSSDLIHWSNVSTNGPFLGATNLNLTYSWMNSSQGYFRLLLQ